MEGSSYFLRTLFLLVFVMGEILTAASMFNQQTAHSPSIDSTKTPTEQLAMLTKRMDELEQLRFADVNGLIKRLDDLLESRETDALEMTRLNQEVEELKRFHNQDSHRITLLSEQVAELQRYCVYEEETEDVSSKQEYSSDREETQFHNETFPSAAAPSADVSTTNEKDSSVHLDGTSDTKSVRGRSWIKSRHHRKILLDRQLNDNVIAFHAVLTRKISNPTLGQTIVFDTLSANSGGTNYNTNTGQFTCTQSGVYVFSWSVSVWGHQFIYSNLVRNNIAIGSVQVGQATQWDSASSATLVSNLDVGDTVSVRIGSHVTGSDVYPYSSMFTGFRLQ